MGVAGTAGLGPGLAAGDGDPAGGAGGAAGGEVSGRSADAVEPAGEVPGEGTGLPLATPPRSLGEADRESRLGLVGVVWGGVVDDVLASEVGITIGLAGSGSTGWANG
jgi:hypothetical protein